MKITAAVPIALLLTAARIAAQSFDAGGTTTRAVVVGISDYQDEGIPDLRFADKDAEAFANFLRSPAGGGLDNDHLQVLTNKNATAGRVAEALDNLIERAKEGDEVIIYFSGHGDVEGKKLSQPGFLLCWDAPSRVYMGGGTYSLAYLQEIVSTLSVQNKAKVVVVTDACHAGKLAGSQIGGAQLTAANLAKQFANEIKILSCQPGELSLEGEQWGGGRGIFSYHLVDGLLGLADKNSDGSVSLGELDRYLEDKVTAEAAPQSQVPILLGNKTERLATVSAAILAELKKAKASGLPVFAATEGRGFEDEVLAKLDSGIVKRYFDFKKAVAEKRFFQPENDCAEAFYASLSTEPGLAPLHGSLKRNYAAALQDDAQQVINTMLKTGLTELVLSGAMEERLYENYPRYLGRAAELLGPTHYLYKTLMARQAFFKGKTARTREERKQNFLGALEWQPAMPLALLELGVNEGPKNLDSAKIYLMAAAEQLPIWVLPHVKMSNLYAQASRFDDAFASLETAGRLDSTSVLVWYEKAGLNSLLHFYDAAEPLLQKVIKSTSDEVCFPCAHMELGRLNMQKGRPKDAQVYFRSGLALSKNSGNTKGFCNPCAYVNIGIGYWMMDSLNEAAVSFKKAIEVDSNFIPAYQNLGTILILLKNMPEAEKYLKKCIQMRPKNAVNYSNLGQGYYMNKRYKEAEEYLLKAIELDTTNPETYTTLGDVYRETGQFLLAEKHYRNALKINSERVVSWQGLGKALTKMGRLAEAEPVFQRMLFLEANNPAAFYGLAAVNSLRKNTHTAFDQLELALKNGFKDFEAMQEDPDLQFIREKKARKWKALMKKHFPDKVKD